jgi:hypothetical protein
MPVHARRFIRKMRGGAQAHLIEADDGKFYVVKFRNNPQHRRILINELIASHLLRYLQIAAPAAAFIELAPEFLEANPEVHIQLGNSRLKVETGWHFGSCFPGHPDKIAVYDFVPDTLLKSVENLRDFLGVLVFDKWTANVDSRQSVFVRVRIREFMPRPSVHPQRVGFMALMIDHGFIFNGPHWEYTDSPIQGLYFRTSVYETVSGLDDFEPWLSQVIHFPEEVIDGALREIPPAWLNGDRDYVEPLLEKLMRRRKRVPDLLEECARGRSKAFPNWG